MPITTPIKARDVAIAHIRKLLSDLITENNTYINGQVIFAIDDLGKVGIKVGDWNFLTDDISLGTAFVDLPWVLAPEASGASGTNAWTIANGNPTYALVGVDGIITDPRLIGVTDPLVTTTKTNTMFRPGEFTIDSVAGTLTLIGFGGMDDTDVIAIVVPSFITTALSNAALDTRITALETIMAPFTIGGGKAILIWPRPVAEIPAGWHEVVEMKGMFLSGFDGTDADFDTLFTAAGSNTQKLNANQIPQLSTTLHVPLYVPGGDTDRGGLHSLFSIDTDDDADITVGEPAGTLQDLKTIPRNIPVVFITPD